MPIYEYQCTSCHRHQEVLQKLSDPPLQVCEECGGPMEKQISSPAFQFKGSGWYVTDYARKDEAKRGKTSNGDSASAAKSEDSKGGSDPSSSDSSEKTEKKEKAPPKTAPAAD